MSFGHQIELFSITSIPVKPDGFEAVSCVLDELAQMEETLSDVPKSQIMDMMKDQEPRILPSLTCQYQASLYQIKKLPAIVIDHQYVAYGVDSVSRAITLFENRGENNG